MWDLVGNPEDRFSDVAAHISVWSLGQSLVHNKMQEVIKGVLLSLNQWLKQLRNLLSLALKTGMRTCE